VERENIISEWRGLLEAPKKRASKRGLGTCGPEITTEQTTFKTGNLNFKIGDGGLEGRMVKELNKGRISEQEEAKFRIGADV
jgi:hypothetical protein